MKKVVFFVTGLDSGGLENYLLRFLQHKASCFKDVVIFCKGGKAGQLEKSFLNLPNVSIIKKKIGFFNLGDSSYLKRNMRKGQFDVVCDFTGNFSGITLFLAKQVGIKNRVACYRGAKDHFSKTIIKNVYNYLMNRLTLTSSTSILSNSKSAFDNFFPVIWEKNQKFQIIHNGLNPKPFLQVNTNLRAELNIPDDAFVVGHTGRFNSAKNHLTIINVAENLIKIRKDVYFILCGNGVKENLQSLVESKNIQDKVLLFENRSDIPQFLNTMDCYFFPSITEGQPNALIEAMTMGLPFVASNIDPIKETVGEQYYENLYPFNDLIGYTTRLNELASLRLKRNKILSDEMIERFNYEILFDQFYSVLNKK